MAKTFPSLLKVGNRVSVGGSFERALTGHDEEANGAIGIGPTPSVLEVVGDRGRVLRQCGRVDLLESVRESRVQPLPVHEGDPVGERPADQVVRKREPNRLALDRRGDDAGAFGLVEGVDQLVLRELLQCLEQLETEVAPEETDRGEDPTRVVTERLQAVLDRESGTLGDIDVAEKDRPPTPTRNQQTFVRELAEHRVEEKDFLASPDGVR